MSKDNRGQQPQGKPAQPTPASKQPDVPAYRQCPLCYSGQGGIGRAYSTQGRTRYYKCSNCGHTWTARVVTEVDQVEHRRVDLETRGQ